MSKLALSIRLAKEEWFVEAEHPRLFGGYEWKRLSEIVEGVDENGNKTGIRYRLLISKHIIEQRVFDTQSEDELLKQGGRDYSQSAIHAYLLGDFKNGLQDQSGGLPKFGIRKNADSDEGIWLFSVDDFNKYFPSGSRATNITQTPSAWWLSTTDENNKRALFVTKEGIIHRAKGRDDHDGMWVRDPCGLRPAFWLVED